MKNNAVIILAFFILSFISLNSGCKKKVADENPDFIGYWYGSDGEYSYEIDISETGSSSYLKTNGTTSVSSTGVARIKGDKLKIGLKKFSIEKYPAEVLDPTGYNYWVMTLEGISYARY